MKTDQSMATKKLNVFISYSRKDLDFANRIFTALDVRGLAPKIDTRDLPKLEDWRRELLGFIRAADAIVFIVSPDSIASPVCSWEVEQVAKLNKRLAPIVLSRVPDDLIPEGIAKINYLFFDQPDDFESQADALAKALQTDLTWLKEHTRLGELARRWVERGHASRLTLRGKEIDDAESWIATRPLGAPEPTALHREFISKSRGAATQRMVRTASLVTATAILALGAWEAQAWLAARNHINAQRYKEYIESTLPFHFFRGRAETRRQEEETLRGLPETNPESYRSFADAHTDSPYGKLAKIIYERRVDPKTRKPIFADSTSRQLSSEEIKALPGCEEILIARNEISYKLGHCFCSTWGVQYFPNADCDGVIDTQDSASFASNSLSGVRQTNLTALIREYGERKCMLPAIALTACKSNAK